MKVNFQKNNKKIDKGNKIESIILTLCFIVAILTLFGKISIEIYFLINAFLSIPYHIFKEDEEERIFRARIAYLEKEINKKSQ